MFKLMRQIARAGICTEPPPDVDESEPNATQIHDEILAILGQALPHGQKQVGFLRLVVS